MYEGRGASVLDVKLDASQIVVDATHSGRANFIVKPIDSEGNAGSSIVNAIGVYGGRHLITEPSKVVALQISADGPWKFTFDGAGALRVASPGTTYKSDGDDVLFVDLPAKGLVRGAFTATKSNFIVLPFSLKGTSSGSAVNEIAPWSGTVVIPTDSRILEVIATGPWTMNMTVT